MSHDARSQGIAHHIDHGPESVPGWQNEKVVRLEKHALIHVSTKKEKKTPEEDTSVYRLMVERLTTTYNAQSTAMMRVMSSVGRPTEVRTITMVTSPACGIPAAPILAAVAVMLREQAEEQSAFIFITYKKKQDGNVLILKEFAQRL